MITSPDSPAAPPSRPMVSFPSTVSTSRRLGPAREKSCDNRPRTPTILSTVQKVFQELRTGSPLSFPSPQHLFQVVSPGLLTVPPPRSLSTVTLFSTSQGKGDLPRDPHPLIYIQPWFLAFPTQGPREAGLFLSWGKGASPCPSRGLAPITAFATPCISVPFFPCFVLHRSKLLGRVAESCCQSLAGPPIPSRVLARRTPLDLSSRPLCGFFP